MCRVIERVREKLNTKKENMENLIHILANSRAAVCSTTAGERRDINDEGTNCNC